MTESLDMKTEAHASSSSNPHTYEPTYSVDEFCAVEQICRENLYKAWREGRGPRYYYNGARRRISHQARLDYQREREAEAMAMAHASSSEAA
jgi:hypothetical protein